MPPTVALCVWLVLLLALLHFDPARDRETSLALWVPLVWMFIVFSRTPSAWLGGPAESAQASFQQGSRLDQIAFTALILVAVAILVSRSFRWGEFFARNKALTLFICFALISVLWSDFPLITLKRWFRDLAFYLSILVILTDPRPLEAVRTVLRRLGYLLIPLSILLIKYYPGMATQYSPWSGEQSVVGVTTSKNVLGVVCMVSALYFFWDTVTRWAGRHEATTRRILIVNFAFLVMTGWLLYITGSATSNVCLALGCLVIAVAYSGWGEHHRSFLKAAIPLAFGAYLVLALGFGMNGQMAEAVGRNPTLTSRTDIWKILISAHTNPLLGTGYESFWLGSRLQWVWQQGAGMINEAHNGYLELYLDMGIAGLILLGAFLVSSYRTICKRLNSFKEFGSLSLAIWFIALFYNVTEAAFKYHPMWLMLLLVAIALPEDSERPLSEIPAFRDEETSEHFPVAGWEY